MTTIPIPDADGIWPDKVQLPSGPGIVTDPQVLAAEDSIKWLIPREVALILPWVRESCYHERSFRRNAVSNDLTVACSITHGTRADFGNDAGRHRRRWSLKITDINNGGHRETSVVPSSIEVGKAARHAPGDGVDNDTAMSNILTVFALTPDSLHGWTPEVLRVNPHIRELHEAIRERRRLLRS